MTVGMNINMFVSHIGEKEVYAICGVFGTLARTLLLARIKMCVRRARTKKSVPAEVEKTAEAEKTTEWDV